MSTTKTAIDLYSGIGGWTLGLHLAGIRTVASYEWWGPAARTHGLNFSSPVHELDIRALDPVDVPAVEFVVGSPPCTQFSFSNRGGSGDIEDGLRDIRKFLEIVAAVKPRRWAMENIPRVAGILRKELAAGGQLHDFAALVPVVEVVNVADFGVPQARKRMIAGDFSVELLRSYARGAPTRTLGDVLAALGSEQVVDPIYGIPLQSGPLTANDPETPLDWEELRMNREAKRFHPVYNLMGFPDSRDRPARTVTATCTRVSRESIVVEDSGSYRRLSIRERACLQSFPITFGFVARTHSECLRMTGNAIPPLMTFYLAHAMLGTKPSDLPNVENLADRIAIPSQAPPVPAPDIPTRNYPAGRRFRSAIPGLRFGSGVRFELTNDVLESGIDWPVAFYYGTSKRIETKEVDANLLAQLAGNPDFMDWISRSDPVFRRAEVTAGTPGDELQEVWAHRRLGTHPYEVVDLLGGLVAELIHSADSAARVAARGWVSTELAGPTRTSATAKLIDHSLAVVAGFVVASWFNALRNRAIEGLPSLEVVA